MATRKATTKPSKRELDKIWQIFLRSEPILPKDSCFRFEERERTGSIGQARRLTLRSAEFGGKYLLDSANRDHEGAVSVATTLLMARDWRDYLKAQLDLVESQALRLEMALFEQKDLDGVLAEAKAGLQPAETSHG